MSSSDETRPTVGRRIDQGYYETSGYFERGGQHLLDPTSRFQRYRVREVLRLCGELAGSQVVDLGCGWGTISFALAGVAEAVVGIDFAEASIRLCRSRQGMGEYPNITFIQADARGTDLAEGEWDLIVAADLVEHLYPDDTLAVYREAFRLLRPGGRLVIWTPAPTHILERLRRWRILSPDPTHVDYKTLARVQTEVEACGFRVLEARHAPSHLPVVSVVERLTQRWLPLLRRRVALTAQKGSRSRRIQV